MSIIKQIEALEADGEVLNKILSLCVIRVSLSGDKFVIAPKGVMVVKLLRSAGLDISEIQKLLRRPFETSPDEVKFRVKEATDVFEINKCLASSSREE